MRSKIEKKGTFGYIEVHTLEKWEKTESDQFWDFYKEKVIFKQIGPNVKILRMFLGLLM